MATLVRSIDLNPFLNWTVEWFRLFSEKRCGFDPSKPFNWSIQFTWYQKYNQTAITLFINFSIAFLLNTCFRFRQSVAICIPDRYNMYETLLIARSPGSFSRHSLRFTILQPIFYSTCFFSHLPTWFFYTLRAVSPLSFIFLLSFACNSHSQ